MSCSKTLTAVVFAVSTTETPSLSWFNNTRPLEICVDVQERYFTHQLLLLLLLYTRTGITRMVDQEALSTHRARQRGAGGNFEF